jgi:hypothetical protein
MRIGAVLEQVVGARAQDMAGLVERQLQRHFLFARRICSGHVLEAILDPFDRARDQDAGGDRRHLFAPGLSLQPEGAADILGDHPDFRLRISERHRQEAGDERRALAADIDGDFAGTVLRDHDSPRFHGILADALVLDPAGDAVRRLFEDLVQFGIFAAFDRRDIARHVRMHERAGQGVADRDNRLLLLVFDGHERGGVLSDKAAFRDHDGDGIADIGDPAIRERIDRCARRRRDQEHADHLDIEMRQIILRKHRYDTRNLGGDRNVDRQDPAARDRAAREGGMQNSWKHDVVDEDALARQQPVILLAGDTLADEARSGPRLRIHVLVPRRS